MTDILSLDTFLGLVGERCTATAPGLEPLGLTLGSAVALGNPGGPDARAPFSLTFAGPAQPVLPQRIYTVAHDRLGTLDIFLVPLGPRGDAMLYEAIFT
ncbi:MAG: DUF6916 family protein [Dehalococcoidia bacterium]